MSQKLFVLATQRCGEIAGLFKEDGSLIRAWSCNDFSWTETTDRILVSLGFEVLHKLPKNFKKEELEQKLAEYFGDELDPE